MDKFFLGFALGFAIGIAFCVILVRV